MGMSEDVAQGGCRGEFDSLVSMLAVCSCQRAMTDPATLPLLVVEDDRAVARAIARLLRRRGHSVHVTHSFEAALSRNERYDCGIFDVDLPDGGGIELATELLEQGRVRRCVFFSASPDTSVARRAEKLGEFVHKTSGVAELARAVASALSATRRRRKAANGGSSESEAPQSPKSGLRKKV